MTLRLGVLTSHPIQYYAPLFRELATRIQTHVFYAHDQSARAQADAGFGVPFEWDVDLFSGYEHSFLKNEARRPNVSRFGGCHTPAIDDAIQDGRFDAFLVTGWHLRCYWQAVNACRRRAIPVLVRGDSHLATPRTWPRQLVKTVTHRYMLSRFDGFLVVGERNREYLRHYGVPSDKLFDSPHAIDASHFARREGEARARRAHFLAALGLPANAVLLLYVGKLAPLKRPGDLIDAAERLRHAGRSVGVVFAGDGPLRDALVERAAASRTPALHLGFRNQSQLPLDYAAADILVLPSVSESWGLVVNEAMAAGTPAVVTTEVGAAPDLVDEGRTGAVYPGADVAALVAAIERTIPLVGQAVTARSLAEKTERYSLARAATGIVAAATRLVS